MTISKFAQPSIIKNHKNPKGRARHKMKLLVDEKEER